MTKRPTPPRAAPPSARADRRIKRSTYHHGDLRETLIEQGLQLTIAYADAKPIKTFICPSRRGTSEPWADYAGAFSVLQQIPSPPPVPPSDPNYRAYVALSHADSILDNGSAGVTMAQITSADGLSNTLFYAHKFVQPKNYDKLNEPPFSPYDTNSTLDAGWSATEVPSGAAPGPYQPAPAAPYNHQTIRSNWEVYSVRLCLCDAVRGRQD